MSIVPLALSLAALFAVGLGVSILRRLGPWRATEWTVARRRGRAAASFTLAVSCLMFAWSWPPGSRPVVTLLATALVLVAVALNLASSARSPQSHSHH